MLTASITDDGRQHHRATAASGRRACHAVRVSVRPEADDESGENVLVVVALVEAEDAAPTEVLVLRRLDPQWDEARYLSAVTASLAAHDRFTLTVTRTRSVWERPPRHEALVSLRLGVMRDENARVVVRHQAQGIVRRLVEGGPSTNLSRSEAIARARAAVGAGWDRSDPDRLQVSEEEHRPSEGVWVLGLTETAGLRYRVEVGAVDGHPWTVHVVRTEAAEVSDSIGT